LSNLSENDNEYLIRMSTEKAEILLAFLAKVISDNYKDSPLRTEYQALSHKIRIELSMSSIRYISNRKDLAKHLSPNSKITIKD